MIVALVRWMDTLPERNVRALFVLLIILLGAVEWNQAMRIRDLETTIAVIQTKLEDRR